MTYGEAMALSGRALDAAVAEHVYGRPMRGKAGSLYTADNTYWLFYSRDIGLAMDIMRRVLSLGARAQNMFYAALWGQAPAAGPTRWRFEYTLTALIVEGRLPEAICRAAVYVATQPRPRKDRWM